MIFFKNVKSVKLQVRGEGNIRKIMGILEDNINLLAPELFF